MRSPLPLPALIAALSLTLAPGEAHAMRAPRPLGAAVLEYMGGLAGGILFSLAAGRLAAATAECTDDGGFWGGCDEKLGRAFLGGLAGFTIGTPLGVYLAGGALGQGGSGAGATVGSVLGELAAIPLLFASDSDSPLTLPVVVLIPAAAGTFAYHAFAAGPWESETAARWRAAPDRRFAALAPPAGTRGDGVRIALFKARF